MLKFLLITMGISMVVYFALEMITVYAEFYDEYVHRLIAIFAYIICFCSVCIPLVYKNNIVFIICIMNALYWLTQNLINRDIYENPYISEEQEPQKANEEEQESKNKEE